MSAMPTSTPDRAVHDDEGGECAAVARRARMTRRRRPGSDTRASAAARGRARTGRARARALRAGARRAAREAAGHAPRRSSSSARVRRRARRGLRVRVRAARRPDLPSAATLRLLRPAEERPQLLLEQDDLGRGARCPRPAGRRGCSASARSGTGSAAPRPFEDARQVLHAMAQLNEPHGDLVEVWEVGRGHRMDCDLPKLLKLTVWTKPNEGRSSWS